MGLQRHPQRSHWWIASPLLLSQRPSYLAKSFILAAHNMAGAPVILSKSWISALNSGKVILSGVEPKREIRESHQSLGSGTSSDPRDWLPSLISGAGAISIVHLTISPCHSPCGTLTIDPERYHSRCGSFTPFRHCLCDFGNVLTATMRLTFPYHMSVTSAR